MKNHKTSYNKEYGFRHLDPIPSEEEINEFYQREYYKIIRETNKKKPDQLYRLTGDDDKEKTAEREWLKHTLYGDICHFLDKFATGKSVLDVGCGTGELMMCLTDYGLDSHGIEPSQDAYSAALKSGCKVFNRTLEEHIGLSLDEKYDAVTLINVLEHVTDPVKMIEQIKKLIDKDGIICISVPNEFTEIQAAAQKSLDTDDEWWVAVPDHINYFDHKSIQTFLSKLGFEVLYLQCDFPMEMFLMMGHDYIGEPSVGGKCHKRRVKFEMSLPSDLRRAMYNALGNIGVGRDCLVFGKLK